VAKIIIVKKGGNITSPQPCPFMIDWGTEKKA
jgi:hypothetical protein